MTFVYLSCKNNKSALLAQCSFSGCDLSGDRTTRENYLSGDRTTRENLVHPVQIWVVQSYTTYFQGFTWTGPDVNHR